MRVLITGGTGTLGQALVRKLKFCRRLVIFSRDEQKHFEMMKQYPEGGEKGIRYIIGDIRDYNSIKTALKDIDVVIHAAAMKHVHLSEYCPEEAIKTNIQGSMNVAKACHEMSVSKAILISTDKAVSPINLYGATKLAAEKYFISANNLGKCRFSVCRYGNVEGSKGSIIPIWKKAISEGVPIKITDRRMTRFWITVEEAANFVINKLYIMQGGEIFVPELGRKRLLDIANELGSPAYEEIGLRPGEKLHECLINEAEAVNCYKQGDFYIIYPQFHDWTKDISRNGIRVEEGFTFTSEIQYAIA